MELHNEKKYYYSSSDYITYSVYGVGSKVLVLIHGFGASKANWEDVIKGIPLDQYTIYALDLKGCGNSTIPHDSKYSIEDNAHIIYDFIKSNRFKNYSLVGHSLGGAVAIFIALQSYHEKQYQPEAMILLDPAAYKTDLPFFVNYLRIPVLRNIILNMLSAEFQVKYTLKRIVYDTDSITDDVVERYAIPMKRKGYDYGLKHTALDIVPQQYNKFTTQYKNLKLPVLIIWGAQDPVLPPVSGKKLSTSLPNARLKLIEKCGHNPHEEKPAEVINSILEFLAKPGINR